MNLDSLKSVSGRNFWRLIEKFRFIEREKMATNAQYIAAQKKLRDMIDQKHAAMVELSKSGDYDGIVGKFYADKCKTISPSGQTIDGKPAHIEELKKLNLKDDPWTIKVDECNGEGDWCYVRGTFKTNKDSGKYLTVWKKVGDTFLIWNDIYNSSKAPA